MANLHRQWKGHARTGKRTRDATFEKASKPRFGRIPARQAVFELSPKSLRSFLDIDDERKYSDSESEEITDEILDEESDFDDHDDDEPVTDEEPGEWYSNRYLACLRESLEFAGLPIIDLGGAYSISINKEDLTEYWCNFQEPNWFHQAMRSDSGPYIKRLVLFLRALSEWLEEERQLFLAEPSPTYFVAIDESYPENPVVLQNGLLVRINARLPEYDRLNEQDFSRLLDKIWLLWAQWNMPLRHVFSKEYQTEWVIQGCLQRHKKIRNGTWIKELSNDFTKEDLRQAKRKDFSNLTITEMFHLLCDIVDGNPKKIHCLVRDRIQQGEKYDS